MAARMLVYKLKNLFIISLRDMFPILKDPIVYLISVYIGKLSSFVYMIIIARILGPAEYGLWNALLPILLYASFLDLGSIFASVKEISFYKGQKKQNEIDEIRNTTFFSVIIIATAVAITLLMVSVFFNKSDRRLSGIFSLMAVIIILNRVRSLLFSNFYADKKFKAASASIILYAFSGILTIILVIKFGLIGVPLGMFTVNLLLLPYLFNRYGPYLSPRINIRRFFSLVKIGFPIMLLSMTYWVFLSIDRVLIFKYLGKLANGYYSLSSTLTGIIILFPSSFGIFIFPRISEEFGATGEIEKLKGFLNKPNIMLAYFIALLLGVLYIILPLGVKILIPQYAMGVEAARLTLIGVFFLSVSVFAQKLLVATNRQLNCFFLTLSVLFLKILLINIFINRNLGIEGVALAANISYFIYSFFILIYAFYYVRNKILKVLIYIFKIFLPLPYLLFFFLCYNYLQQTILLSTSNKILHISISCIILTIFVIMPFAFVVKKNLSMFLQEVSKMGAP